ncbi:MAG TPA: hypothetical protein VJ970_07080 [Flavobacteriaceae bacterium]|nr:hypothetical protein [Flavobacteriaceae bacterium]
MIGNFIFLLQQVDIEKKMAEAPDKSYEIGVVIGTYLPFVLLVLLAYLVFWRTKNRKDLDN